MKPTNTEGVPEGWLLSGTCPQNYKVRREKINGTNLLVIAQIEDAVIQEMTGFGTVAQVIGAQKFFGKRIELSALMKVINVPDWSWAGLWMRIDGSDETFVLDNMYERRLTGTTEWVDCSIVLDVPVKSAQIAFGVLIHGAGEVAVCNMKLKPVSNAIRLTKDSSEKSYPKLDRKLTIKFDRDESVNLSFAD